MVLLGIPSTNTTGLVAFTWHVHTRIPRFASFAYLANRANGGANAVVPPYPQPHGQQVVVGTQGVPSYAYSRLKHMVFT